jgi:ribosomal RNA-processing protein 1
MSAFISRLVHVFTHVDTTLLFIQVFFETEAREWHGIDRWRMDKFMMVCITYCQLIKCSFSN